MHLEKFPFYKQLDTPAKNFLHQHLKPIKLPKESLLFFQGDVCEHILFLTEGKVRLYMQSENAEEITLYHLYAGEQCIVNTSSTLSQTEAIGSAVTATEIEGYLLDVKNLKKLAHMSESYQSFLFSIYTLRMEALAQLVNDLKFKKLDERILDWLQNHENKIIETTHETIANELGSTRVAVSRLLKELEKEKKIKLSRGIIELF